MALVLSSVCGFGLGLSESWAGARFLVKGALGPEPEKPNIPKSRDLCTTLNPKPLKSSKDPRQTEPQLHI